MIYVQNLWAESGKMIGSLIGSTSGRHLCPKNNNNNNIYMHVHGCAVFENLIKYLEDMLHL